MAILYSCGLDQLSHCDQGEGGLSHFTRALCDALSAEDDRGTIAEIVAAMQQRLDALTPAGAVQTITLDERQICGRAGDPRRLVLKENRAARLRQRIEASAWCRQLAESPLWDRVHRTCPALALHLHALVLGCEEAVAEPDAGAAARDWTDPRAPQRVLRRIVRLAGAADWLTPAEAALVLVTPYVYEGVLALAR